MSKPILSVLIPAYNVENYIVDCVNSILEQNNGGIEVIVLDDGSTDGTLSVLKEHYTSNEVVKIIHTQNHGLLAARRYLLKESTGDFILFVDSDDMLRCDAISIICDIFDKNELDILIFNASQYKDFSVPFRKKDYKYNYKYIGDELYYLKKELVTTTNLNNLCFKVIKRKIVDVENNYDNFGKVTSGEDALQTLAIFDAAQSVMFLNENLYYYRPNPTSITHIYNSQRYYSTTIVLKEIERFVNIWGMDEETRIAFHKRCIHSVFFCIKDIIKSDNSFTDKSCELKRIANDTFFIEEKKYIDYVDNGIEKILLYSMCHHFYIPFHLISIIHRIFNKASFLTNDKRRK